MDTHQSKQQAPKKEAAIRKLRTMIFSLGLLAVAVLGVMYVSTLMKDERVGTDGAEAPIEAAVQQGIREWRTYQNATYGFSVEYPGTLRRWTEERPEFMSFRGVSSESKKPILVNITVETDPEYTTVDAFVEAQKANPPADSLELQSPELVAIDGAPAVTMVEHSTDSGSTYLSALIFKDNRIMTLRVLGARGVAEEEITPIFDHLVATFAFSR